MHSSLQSCLRCRGQVQEAAQCMHLRAGSLAGATSKAAVEAAQGSTANGRLHPRPCKTLCCASSSSRTVWLPCRYRRLRIACVCLQTAWRARQARLLLRQHQAARQVQAAARGWLARKRLAHAHRAAIKIQVGFLRLQSRRGLSHANCMSHGRPSRLLRQHKAAQQEQAALKIQVKSFWHACPCWHTQAWQAPVAE